MNKFAKIDIKNTNGTITHIPTGKFIARFKRGRGGASTFITHICRNWTVDAYFAEMDAGKSPLAIVEQTNYLLPHIKRWLKEAGKPLTTAAYKEMIREASARRHA